MKFRTKILLVLVFLVILGFILLLPGHRYQDALKAYKQQLLAKGEKLTMVELAPQPHTNAFNGARALLDLMTSNQAPSDYPAMMKIVAPGLAAIGSTNIVPAEMLSYERNTSTMVKLRKILEMPVLDFNLNYSLGPQVGAALFPELSYLKKAELLPAMTAMQALYMKDYSEARLDLIAAADLVRLDTNEPLMISDLVRCAMANIAFGATWEGLQRGEWTDPQLVELQSVWQRLNMFKNCEAAVPMERAWGLAELAEIRATNASPYGVWPGPAFSISVPSSGGGALANLQDKLKELYDRYPRFWRWKSSWSYEEELCDLQIEDATLESARLANTTGAFVPAIWKFNQTASNIDQLHPDATNHFLFSDPTGQSYGRYLLKLAEVETGRHLTVTAIALKRYHLQHSTYPTALSDLVPVYLADVPLDFMDGKPLRYKLRPDGDFLLYSVGEDGVDNGGDPTPVPPASSSSFNWRTGRDIVWPRVATPAALEEYHRQSQANTNVPDNH